MSYIYEEYDYSLFESRFRDYERYDQMGGYDGLKCLYNYLDDLASYTDEPIKFDCIGLCCEWSYCDDDDLTRDYSYLMDDDLVDIDDLVEELEQRTTVLKTDDGKYLIQEF